MASTERTRFNIDALLSIGRPIFALAIIALGVETMVCARYVSHSLGPRYDVIPALPWLPAIPGLAYAFGLIWVVCGAGLFSQRSLRPAAMALGGLLFSCALILDVPKNAVDIGSISLRTIVFEPFALACLAWLLPGPGEIPAWLERASRYLLALSFIAFGLDHFLALGFIANIIPSWIPFHTFWVAFFGVEFIAAALSIAFNIRPRWGAAGIGLMFGIWVVTLHIPRVLGLYSIPDAPYNPNEWSSLFIAMALWGGCWALARNQEP